MPRQQATTLGMADRCVLLALMLIAASAEGIGLARNADLSFGEIVSSNASGTVTVTATGARSAAGGAYLGNGVSVSAAVFTVSGTPQAAYSISLPGSATLSCGAVSMVVDAFNSNPSGSGQLDSIGTQQLVVGATLHVAANQPNCSYSGSFNVTVSYE